MFSVFIPKDQAKTKQILLDPLRMKENKEGFDKLIEGSKKNF